MLALIFGLIVWLLEPLALKLGASAIALSFVSLGLALNSFWTARHIDKRMDKMDATLTQIVDLQQEIQKEQKEQASSRSPIVTSLQALSQYYLDYIAKQKREGEQHK